MRNGSTIDLMELPPPRDFDICFLGNRYDSDEFSKSLHRHDAALRDEVVLQMKQAFGDRFGLFGAGWSGFIARHGIQHEDVIAPLDRAHEYYWRSRIGLNISLSNDLYAYSSDRLHRILGCGCLLLTKKFPMMSVLGLEHDKNCLSWDTVEQAVELAKNAIFFLVGGDGDDMKQAIQDIASAGAELAKERHSWNARMLELQLYVDAVRKAR